MRPPCVASEQRLLCLTFRPLGSVRVVSHRIRHGFTVPEVLIVLVTMGILFALSAPRFTVLREQSAARAARLQLGSAFAAARAAAVQKGRPATLTIDDGIVRVTVLTGLSATTTTVLGPLRLDGTEGSATLASIDGPTTVTYDPRGMITPGLATVARYQLTAGDVSDTLCVSAVGMVLSRDCRQ